MLNSRIIQIIEIIKLAAQGRSEPYLCVGEDGNHYYVKGRQSGLSTRVNEWICAHLAKSLGLPIPEFRLVEIPPELIAITAPHLRTIGAGIGFASKSVPFSCWFEEANIPKVDDELQCKLLIFDWWIHNEDRCKENPNLLWDSAHQQVAVIDHNLAFDTKFDFRNFKRSHLFAHHWDSIASDMFTRLTMQKQLESVLPVFEIAVNSIPEEWLWIDPEQTISATLDINRLRNQLLRCNTDDFWRT